MCPSQALNNMIKLPPTLLKIQESLADVAAPTSVLPPNFLSSASTTSLATNFLTSSTAPLATNFLTSSAGSPSTIPYIPTLHLAHTTPFTEKQSSIDPSLSFIAPCSTPSGVPTSGAVRIISPKPVKGSSSAMVVMALSPTSTGIGDRGGSSPGKPSLSDHATVSPTSSSDSGCYTSTNVSRVQWCHT